MWKKNNMLMCTLGDIELLRKAGASFHVALIPIHKRDAIWYRVEFTMTPLEGQAEHGLLITTRNDPYTRASLDKLLDLMRESFPPSTTFSGVLFPDENADENKI